MVDVATADAAGVQLRSRTRPRHVAGANGRGRLGPAAGGPEYSQPGLRITTTGPTPPALGYDASRGDSAEANFVKVTFPAATAARPGVEYRLEVAALYPSLRRIDGDRRFDGFRRNGLNIIQLNPRFRAGQ